MAAPNHGGDIDDLFNRAGLTPKVETASDEGRRSNLFALVLALNAHDGVTSWGVLVKTDQGGKIPADIAVWQPTLEHFDVLEGDSGGPTWQPKGVVPSDTWIWRAVDGVAGPGPSPGPTPGSTPSASGGVLDEVLGDHQIPGTAGRAIDDSDHRGAQAVEDLPKVAAELRTHTDGQHTAVLQAIAAAPGGTGVDAGQVAALTALVVRIEAVAAKMPTSFTGTVRLSPFMAPVTIVFTPVFPPSSS